jgi:hypothetical protein
MDSNRRSLLLTLSLCLLLPVSMVGAVPPYGPENADFTIVVMDPMAAPLACDCVQGYAQRKYEALADYMSKKSGKTFRVVWSESLEVAIAGDALGKVDLVIGKDSVVRHESLALPISKGARINVACLSFARTRRLHRF